MNQNLNIGAFSDAENKEPIQFFDVEDGLIYVDQLQGLKNEIDSFVDLGNNWDGYGAIATFPEIAEKSKRFISLLHDTFIDLITDIFPNPHGTITIEWENCDQEKLSLEIGKSNYSYFIEAKDNNPQFFNGQALPSLEEISSKLGELYKDELPRLSIY
jgi:hypothetical protein